MACWKQCLPKTRFGKLSLLSGGRGKKEWGWKWDERREGKTMVGHKINNFIKVSVFQKEKFADQ